jgi:hypothetical protein
VNVGPAHIAEVRWKPCGAGEDAYAPLAESAVSRGTSLRVDEYAGCRDLVAMDAEGNVLGRQDNLSLVPGTTWVIR